MMSILTRNAPHGRSVTEMKHNVLNEQSLTDSNMTAYELVWVSQDGQDTIETTDPPYYATEADALEAIPEAVDALLYSFALYDQVDDYGDPLDHPRGEYAAAAARILAGRWVAHQVSCRIGTSHE